MQPGELATLQGVKLSAWLRSAPRTTPPYAKFYAFEIVEESVISDKVRLLLKKLLTEALFDLELLEKAATYLGWQKVREMIASKAAKGMKLQRGDFGEIITNSILEEFFGYVVPIQKLRYRIDSDQSLPGTDSIVLKSGGQGLTEVCYVESKTRTTSSPAAAVQGYQQLMTDYSQPTCEMTEFIMARMQENHHPLFSDFLAYMRDRKDMANVESLTLGLVWDAEMWKETCLGNLEKNKDSSIPKLVVLLIQLRGLRQLIADIYQSIGVTEVLEDE